MPDNATIQPIHPFPARMAPDIALRACEALPPGSLVLDPMLGSGTVARMASEHGHRAIGFDMDPLAVLMSRVWTTPISPKELRAGAADLISGVEATRPEEVSLPWIEEDTETEAFVRYWFGPEQRADLRRLSYKLHDLAGPVADALRIALSRIIVTKDRGASLARDVSHSRPHKVREASCFPVIQEFAKSAERLARQLALRPPSGGAEVRLGDARNLRGVSAECVDAVITSPPYLNAIDYLRGHKLSLVWLG
ncbi:MAG TPA: DNA methyltransferase [Chloroflexia bacterium]|nr:DNA methyltransferase [Chloroflexia bacterium]